MTYRDYEIIVERPGFGQFSLDENGEIGWFTDFVEDDGQQWYVVRDKDAYVESGSSLEEAKQYIDWWIDGAEGSTFTFEPLEQAA